MSTATTTTTKLALAAEAAAKITARLTSFSATLRINHLPLFARVAATHARTAENVSAVGAAVTQKGQFYIAGSGPVAAGDLPFLYLLVESREQAAVVAGMRVIEEAIREKGEEVVELRWETSWAGGVALPREMVLPFRMA